MRLVAIDVSGLPLLSGSQRCCLREALARAYLLQRDESGSEPTFKIVDLRTPKLDRALKGLQAGVGGCVESGAASPPLAGGGWSSTQAHTLNALSLRRPHTPKRPRRRHRRDAAPAARQAAAGGVQRVRAARQRAGGGAGRPAHQQGAAAAVPPQGRR